MKTFLILLFVTSFFSICCDEEMFYDYIIQNECNKSINVQFETYDIPDKTISINNGFTDTIYSYSIIEGMKIDEKKIIFNRINIMLDTVISKVDFMSNDSWEYIRKSNTHAVYFLKVDTTYFN